MDKHSTPNMKPPKRKRTVKNQIMTFFHCGECLKTLPANISPRDHAALEIGWTREGLQIWCKRHEINVTAIDFRGARVVLNCEI